MILEPQRHLFEIPDGITYLNSAYFGPRLRAVSEAGRGGVAKGAAPWTISADDFFTPVDELRALFGRLINGDADGVALVSSVSYGVETAAINVLGGEKELVVVLESQFPSNVYPWREAVARFGGEVVPVPRGSGSWTADVIAAIDGRTAVVALPNCHWTDGSYVDLAAVGRAARARGAALVVDVTQSLGVFPFDIGEVDPDFVIAAAYKWLLGPYGMAYMWVAPRHRAGSPLEFNWANREGAEDFTSLVDYLDEYRPGARRFDVGERANFTLVPMAAAALTQILQWGVGDIAETIGQLTALAEDEARKRNLATLAVPERAAHFIGMRFEEGVPPGLVDRLGQAGIYVSVRGDSIRVTPHLHNTPEDIARLFAVLDAAR